MNRRAETERTTRETKVRVGLDLDGRGTADIDTGVGFFDHLLTSLAHHALFDLTLVTEGDLHIDDHHTVEDSMLVLGATLGEALGDRAGIQRFGDAEVAMDEARVRSVVDVGGRPYSVVEVPFRNQSIGNFTTQNYSHGLEAFARTGGITLHLYGSGDNDHHVAEAGFKALARALRTAVAPDPRRDGVPSTKGTS